MVVCSIGNSLSWNHKNTFKEAGDSSKLVKYGWFLNSKGGESLASLMHVMSEKYGDRKESFHFSLFSQPVLVARVYSFLGQNVVT